MTTALPRDFKGIWIPKEIWLDRSLSYFEKCLLAEIYSLDGPDGCFASNEYLCKFFNERERKIQDGLANLKAKGYIFVESFDGRTRRLRTNLHPQNDKSFFSTSGMSNSAPLGCQNPHPSHYIEKKDLEKTTTREVPKAPTAAVSSKEKPKIHKCLESIDIPIPDKIEISKTYDEGTVAHAVSYATHPLTKITKGLAPCIKWACQIKPEIPKHEQDIIDENKNFALKTISVTKKNPAINVDFLSQQIEITFPTSQKAAEHIPFDDKNFKETLTQKLKFYKLL